jgi:hypothetical protein
MRRCPQSLRLCVLAAVLCSAAAEPSRWERILQASGAAAAGAQAPAALQIPAQVLPSLIKLSHNIR